MGNDNRAVIDTETGEYLTALLPGDRILRSEIIGRLQTENQNKMSFNNGQWGKAYNDALNKLARLPLTAADYKMILLFLPLVRQGSGLVAYGNYRPVKFQWICDQLKISSKTAQRSLKRLADYRVITHDYSGGETIYFFNPYIYQRGRLINKTLFEMFKKSIWANETKSKTA